MRPEKGSLQASPTDARSPLHLRTLPSPLARQPPGKQRAGWGRTQVGEDLAPAALGQGGPPPAQRRDGRGTIWEDGWDLQLQRAAPPAKPAQLMSALGSAYVRHSGVCLGDLLPPPALCTVPHQWASCLCEPEIAQPMTSWVGSQGERSRHQ